MVSTPCRHSSCCSRRRKVANYGAESLVLFFLILVPLRSDFAEIHCDVAALTLRATSTREPDLMIPAPTALTKASKRRRANASGSSLPKSCASASSRWALLTCQAFPTSLSAAVTFDRASAASCATCLQTSPTTTSDRTKNTSVVLNCASRGSRPCSNRFPFPSNTDVSSVIALISLSAIARLISSADHSMMLLFS